MKRLTLVLASIAIAVSAFAADGPIVSGGKITNVTVYRGQALVTRQLDLELPEGMVDLVVPVLPARILPESIYAQAADPKVKILSVRVIQRAIGEEPIDEIRALDRQIEEVGRTIKHLTAKKEHLDRQWRFFEGLKDFTITAEKLDLNRGVLSFEPLQGLASLIEDKGEEYLNRSLELADQIEQTNKRMDLLLRQRSQLAAGRSRTERQALVTIDSPGGKVHIELNYLVSDASWQPQYNLRAQPDRSLVTIEYIAVVNQTSGEDWNSVSLSLSTAQPTMVAAPAVLEPLMVGLSADRRHQQQLLQEPSRTLEELKEFSRRRVMEGTKGKAASDELNRLAVQNQMLEVAAAPPVAQMVQQEMEAIAKKEGVSVTYDLPGKLSLPSRMDQQIVSIATITAKADFTLIACPLLTDYVYLQAEIENASQTILLQGPASIFRAGQFVGRGDLPLVTMGERFTAGFGIDSQVQVRRQLDEKTSRIQGGNQIDTFKYRLQVNNYKDASVGLRVMDRLPYTDDPAIKIELVQVDPPLSTDPEYLRTQHKKGILRWDLTLAPKTVDSKATFIRYTYTLEYDRNMTVQPKKAQ